MAVDSNNRYTGEELYLQFGGQTFMADFRSFEVSETIDMADSTAGTARDKSHILTLRGATFSYSGLQKVGSGGSAERTALALGASGTLVYGPEGTAAGKPKYSCVASVTSSSTKHPYEDMVELSIDLEKNGAWLAHFEHLASVFP